MHVVIHTDNVSSSWALMTGRTRDPVLAACAREMWLAAAKYGDDISTEHRHGVDIPLADALSRFSHDPSKACYVNDVLKDSGITFVAPVVSDYVFFDPLL